MTTKVIHLIDIDAEDVNFALSGNEEFLPDDEMEEFMTYMEKQRWKWLEHISEGVDDSIREYYEWFKKEKKQ